MKKLIVLLILSAGITVSAFSMNDTQVVISNNEKDIAELQNFVGKIPDGVLPLIGALKARKYLAQHGIEAPQLIKLLGSRGTGKTTLVEAMAQELGVSCMRYHLVDATMKFRSKNDVNALMLHMTEALSQAADKIKGESKDLGIMLYEGLDEVTVDPGSIVHLLRKNKKATDVHMVLILETTNSRLRIDHMRCFDLLVVTSNPDQEERRALLEFFLKGTQLSYESITEETIEETAKASRMCLKRIVNQAASFAYYKDDACITNKYLQQCVPAYLKAISKDDKRGGMPPGMFG
jgi:ATP-dependent 26S proteasome regulatory subunit